MTGTLTILARAAPIATLKCWTPWPHPSLRGHATVVFNSGWVIHAIPVFRLKAGGFSAGGPSAPIVDRDGRQKTDGAWNWQFVPIVTWRPARRGNPNSQLRGYAPRGVGANARWETLISFRDRETRKRFSDLAITALLAAVPTALDPDSEAGPWSAEEGEVDL